MKTPLALTVASLSLLSFAQAAVDFEKDVKPILETSCVRCHNPKGTDYESGKTDLDLSTKATAFESKKVIAPGDPDKSRLYTTTVLPDDHEKVMPPKNKATGKLERLTKEQSETLRVWIKEGAQWPDKTDLIARKAGAELSNASGASDETSLVAQIYQRIVTSQQQPLNEKGMQPYSTTIAGSDVAFDMVPIPGGKFKMGSPDAEAGRKPDEGPQHDVEIAPFWMGKCEVTWNEFELFMYPDEEKKTRSMKKIDPALNAMTDAVTHPTQPYVEMSFGMGKDGYPAISMTQHAANKYCQWLSAKTGVFFRLPTEAEWEYAARAGTTTTYFWGDDAAKIDDYCWWAKNSDLKYQKVGKKKPNPWGLYDILGNVCEWNLDQYDPAFYARSTKVNPWNRATQPYPHVARGGSWDDEDPTKLRIAARRASSPDWKIQDPQLPKSVWYHTDAQFLGFRLVRPLKTPTAEEMQAYWNSGVEKD